MRSSTLKKREEMAELFHSFGHVSEVAKATGYSPHTVQQYLRSMGIVGRAVGVVERNPTACQENETLLLKMLDDGARLTTIAKAVGTNCHRVKEFLRSIGRDKK